MGDAIQASKLRPARVRWTWREIIPTGMLTVIAGEPGWGKSLLACRIAADVSQTADVALSDVEDPWREVVRPRLEASGANLERVLLWTPDCSFVGLSELRYQIEELGIRLLVLDPLGAHVSPSRAGLLPLSDLAYDTGCAIVGIHHVTKYGTTDALERIAGSAGGAAGTARAVYIFGPHPNVPVTDRVLAAVKVNVSRKPATLGFALRTTTRDVPYLELTDEGLPIVADDVLSHFRLTPNEAEVAVACEWLTLYLRFGPRPAAEAIEDGVTAGMTEAALREAATKLGCGSRRWRLPKGHPLL